jgi:virulence factor Mce-like protein
MRLTRQILIQMAIFAVIATTALMIMVFAYMRLPAFLGVGQYRVTVQLPETGGLYPRSNVTYRGVQVGEVKSVQLTDTGVAAVLSLNSDVKIPADLEAEVHSVSSVGEQYVQLLPRSGEGPVLKDGDVVPMDRTTVPTDINAVLDMTNRGLEAIPRDNLKTVVDEANIAVGGLGPELRRLVTGSTTLAIDARANLDPLTTLIDQSKPVLDSQTDTAGSIQAWAANLASISGQLRSQDPAVAGILDKGPGAADEVRALLDRLQPTLPIVLANLVSLGEVALAYQPSLEQLLVLLPQGTAVTQAVGVHKRNTKQDYKGDALVFNLRRYHCRRSSFRRRVRPASCPLSSSGCPPSRTTPTGHRAMCTAVSRKTHRSTCEAPATCPAKPFRANGPRRGRSVKATSPTCRSTTATTGRVTRTRHCRDSQSRMCPPRYHLRNRLPGRVRRHLRSRPLNTIRQPARTLDRTGTCTDKRTWPVAPIRSKHGRRCCCPRRGTERGDVEARSC